MVGRPPAPSRGLRVRLDPELAAALQDITRRLRVADGAPWTPPLTARYALARALDLADPSPGRYLAFIQGDAGARKGTEVLSARLAPELAGRFEARARELAERLRDHLGRAATTGGLPPWRRLRPRARWTSRSAAARWLLWQGLQLLDQEFAPPAPARARARAARAQG